MLQLIPEKVQKVQNVKNEKNFFGGIKFFMGRGVQNVKTTDHSFKQ